ncbi:hypothetical protein PV10_07223 [Exophiala mesophila]|uniref:Uncharacterized protein n=1 Tax=Exophiala mesophila TaxID=212818 RepID=A0A0D1WLI2_EXOME|nr:uncharacterized protein PV10_07223 [Exophiala mesophila]KIV89855.1 hypothetical protein PV10_07223 [Exophiala mesophila]
MSSTAPVTALDHPLIWVLLAKAQNSSCNTQEKEVTQAIEDIQHLLENSLGRDVTQLKVRETRDRLDREETMAKALSNMEYLEATISHFSRIISPESPRSDDNVSTDQAANLKRKWKILEQSEHKWEELEDCRKRCRDDYNREMRYQDELAKATLPQQPTVTDHVDCMTQSNKNIQPQSHVAEDPSAVSSQTEKTTRRSYYQFTPQRGSFMQHRSSGRRRSGFI